MKNNFWGDFKIARKTFCRHQKNASHTISIWKLHDRHFLTEIFFYLLEYTYSMPKQKKVL